MKPIDSEIIEKLNGEYNNDIIEMAITAIALADDNNSIEYISNQIYQKITTLSKKNKE